MILRPFRRTHRNSSIHALYGAIVAQARSPVFYAAYGVPDTVEGRFELIVLHLVLFLNRLGRDGAAAPIGQHLFDLFCRDLDDNLREMGIGDLAVPRKMRRFGEAFYGRQAAYRAALAAQDERALEKALARNIFAVGGVDERAGRLARYACALASLLDATAEDLLIAGKAAFPSPEAFANA
ncbi:MAG TPA: ubiquinol-cytochrome C chaperone family protein [Xanthobacteraceae bacterium]|nr:ubiquinol-cytochrome C chaperone family protein [Xanthobacteraceae bacterium]